MAQSKRSGGEGRKQAKKGPQPVDPPFARLCLITPSAFDPALFAPVLDAALNAGDVASLIIAAEGLSREALAVAAERLVPIAQANGVAAIVAERAALDPSGADGLNVATGLSDLVDAVGALRPARIVGASGIHSRHEAMVFAEADCDYLFFGRFDGDTGPAIHEGALELAAWWSALFEIPAIVMGGGALDCIAEAARARIEFVALRNAVWSHPGGAASAVAEAHRLVLAAQAEMSP